MLQSLGSQRVEHDLTKQHRQYSIVYMHLYLFLCCGHLGFSHVLATVNSAAMDTRVHASFQLEVFSGYMPRRWIAGSPSKLYFQFLKEPPYYSPQWFYQFTFPPAVQGGSLLFTSSPTVFADFFYNGHSNWCEVIPHCSIDLHFSNN